MSTELHLESIKSEQPLDVMWRDYEEKCVPADAGKEQRIQTKQAFYAGCAALNAITHIASEKLSEEEAMQVFSNISGNLAGYLVSTMMKHMHGNPNEH